MATTGPLPQRATRHSRRLRGQQPLPPSGPVRVVGSVATSPSGGQAPEGASPTPQKPRCRDWIVKGCCMLTLLLAVPFCIYSFFGMESSIHPTSDCFMIFYPCGLSLDCSAWRDDITYALHIHACVFCAQIKMEVVTCICNQYKMTSVIAAWT